MTTKNTDQITRFSNLELNDSTPDAAQSAERIVGKTIVATAANKAARERALVEDATGLKLSGTVDGGFAGTGSELWFDEGTTMMKEGVQVALDSRTEWDNLPTAKAASLDHAATVAAEKRQTTTREANSLRLGGSGKLGSLPASPDAPAVLFGEPENHAWRQLTTLAGALDRTPRNKQNVNSWIAEVPSETLRKMRTRSLGGDAPTVFAVLSDRYAEVDGDVLLREMSRRLPGETRARVDYDAESTSLSADLTLHNPYEFEDDITVGRLHRAGVRLVTADNGTSRVRMRAYVERIRCINCTLLPQEWATIDRVHVGDPLAIIEQVRDLMVKVGNAMGEFADVWRAAHVTRVFADASDPAEVRAGFSNLIKGGFVDVPEKHDVTLDRLVRCYLEEPGHTYQAINRAITRAAHAFTWRDSEALEQQAGELLYQRVSVVNQLGW